jgi:hypothetical protein
LRRVPAILTPHLTARAGCLLNLFFPHNVVIVTSVWIPSSKVRLFVLVTCLLLIPGWMSARARPRVATADSDYVPALAAADRFLHAWQSQNQEDGLMMLTDAAKQRSTEEQLEEFFSPRENAAYQISSGKKLTAGRYAFPVALLETSNGGGHLRRRFSEIVVVRKGRRDWVVDRLP